LGEVPHVYAAQTYRIDSTDVTHMYSYMHMYDIQIYSSVHMYTHLFGV
jgi:hypothetical protein